MILKLIAGPDHMLPRSFLPWATATVQHRPSQTGLTHLSLTALWRSLKDGTALHLLLLLLASSSRTKHYTRPFHSSRPSHFSSSCSPKKDVEMPKKNGAHFFSLTFFLTLCVNKTVLLLVISSVTAAVCHEQYCLRLLMSLVHGLLTTTSLSFSQSSHQPDLTLSSVAEEYSLGTSNTEEPE